MNIEFIQISVFELPGGSPLFQLEALGEVGPNRWRQTHLDRRTEYVHVLHVRTDEGIEGICTVGDARYTTMRAEELDQLRLLTIGESAFSRERLDDKLNAATRHMFAKPGWFGAFDNCLWDIAGKAAGLPVSDLLGHAREAAPCYYNFFGATLPNAIEDAERAVEQGFMAVKDHFTGSAQQNISDFEAVRAALGSSIDLMHDAALTCYDYRRAQDVGRVLQALGYRWFEEPLSDRDLRSLQRLCAILDIPVLAPETLMHDYSLCAQWLICGAVDILRANARNGATPTVKLAHLAEMHDTTVELNGPGGLFGLVHAHLCCGLSATTYYEFFPGGTRDLRGKEIGLMNPPLPDRGMIRPPRTPGWGAEWDLSYFAKKRVAEM